MHYCSHCGCLLLNDKDCEWCGPDDNKGPYCQDCGGKKEEFGVLPVEGS